MMSPVFRLIPSALARRSTDFKNDSGMCTVVGMNIFTNISCRRPSVDGYRSRTRRK